jgi:hypothetical protein
MQSSTYQLFPDAVSRRIFPAGYAGRESRKWCGSAARPAARRTDALLVRPTHFATLAHIIRVNLDAKMAGSIAEKAAIGLQPPSPE